MLNSDVGKIKNWKKVCYFEVSKEQLKKEKEEKDKMKKEGKIKIGFFAQKRVEDKGITYEMNGITNFLILKLGMNLGIPTITKDNYQCVFNRINLEQAIFGNFMTYKTPKGKRKEYAITLKDIKKHIGLKTNGSVMTKAQFLKSVTANYEL